MKRQRQSSPQYFLSATRFFELLGLDYATGTRLVKRGVLKPVAYFNDTHPLFAGDVDSIALAKASIAADRVRRNRATQNVKELQLQHVR